MNDGPSTSASTQQALAKVYLRFFLCNS